MYLWGAYALVAALFYVVMTTFIGMLSLLRTPWLKKQVRVSASCTALGAYRAYREK